MTLRDYIRDAYEQGYAIGHFNVSNWEGIKAVSEVCEELRVPVIIGASEGEAGFLGIEHIANIVRMLRTIHGIPLFLNADHFNNLEHVKQAARAGFDAILYDAASKSLGEDTVLTKQAVDAVRAINPDILVEGELGYIGVGSEVRTEIPEGAVIDESHMTTAAEINDFSKFTGVNLVGPAVGNIHGIVKGYKENISLERIKELRRNAHTPMVLHGASGISDDLILGAVSAGISIIHINTELRVAWKTGMEQGLETMKDEVAPYKISQLSVELMKQTLRKKIALFGTKQTAA